MKPKFIYYDPFLKDRARQLRRKSTLSEVLLWNELKHKKLKGYDFHRQKPIAHYIVDFFCPRLSLAIEIDGESHAGRPDEDLRRQREIENLGIHFLRFDDLDVKRNMGVVLNTILDWIDTNEQLHCSPEGTYQARE